MASIFRPWSKGKRATNYCVQFRDPRTGTKRRIHLGTANKTAAEAKAAEIIRRAELEAAGILPPDDGQSARTLASLLVDFVGAMESRGITPKQTQTVDTRLATLFRLAGWVRPADMTARSLEAALESLRNNGTAARTANAYLTHAKQFARWLRLPVDPFFAVKPHQTKAKQVRPRRPLTDAEASRLLHAAQVSKEISEGHDGISRYWAYQLAMGTGLRANEIASLEASSFDWIARTVRVVSGQAKNRTEAYQPIPATIAVGLRSFVESRPHGKTWPRMGRASEFLQVDLAAAGIAFVDAEGRYADFHSLRHTYGTRLARAGVRPSAAQKLMRHSDIRLTLSLYTHEDAQALRGAVDSLPDLDAPKNAPRIGTPRRKSAENGKDEETKKPQGS